MSQARLCSGANWSPPGYAQTVFSLSMLVDEDGVIDPITRFTRSSGWFRQRRGCFLRLSYPTGEPAHGLLLVLEGASDRELATLSEVAAAEIPLVVRILAKCRLHRPIRHNPKYRHSAGERGTDDTEEQFHPSALRRCQFHR